MARRLARFEDEDGCEGPFARAMEQGLPRRRASRSTEATTPTPVVTTKSATTTLETHLELLSRAATAFRLNGLGWSAIVEDLESELAKWERKPARLPRRADQEAAVNAREKSLRLLFGVFKRANENADRGDLEPCIRREVASLFNEVELDDLVDAASWLTQAAIDEKRARRP